MSKSIHLKMINFRLKIKVSLKLTKPLNNNTECKRFANSKAELARQYDIDKPYILCDVITPFPFYHMVNIERREGG